MTEEALQTIDEEPIEIPETETPESGQGEEAGGEISNSDPAGFSKRINQKHFELMEEKRAREAAEAEIARLKAQIPENHKPVIPEMPDPYDADFDERMRQREEAIKQAAIYDAQEQIKQAQLSEQQNALLAKQQSDLIAAVNTYSGRAKALGVSENELQVAGQAVAAYGISEQVAEFILHDDKGPAITTYLAKNPNELDAISKLNPLQAAIHIATNIKPKLTVKTRAADLPDPPDTLNGGGVHSKRSRLKGVRFE